MAKTVYLIDRTTGEAIETTSPQYWKGCEQVSKAKYVEARKAHCGAMLRKWIKPKDKIYTMVTKVAPSGMSRHIRCFIVHEGEIMSISAYVADLIGERYNADSGAVVVGGCGMDMCFHIVYNLGSVLWPNGTPEPHGTRNGKPDSAGGYALNKCDL